MKTEIKNDYIIFDNNEFTRIYTKYLDKGYTDMQGSKNKPNIIDEDFPIALNCDKKEKTMLFGIISKYLYRYLDDEIFVKLYKQRLRIKKLERLENER